MTGHEHSIYNGLRHLADSYGLLVMTLTFLTFVGWALRPGARSHYQDAANSIFAEDPAGGDNG
jgi:cytochrome c oxidase cbb3-type subunit IV